MFIFKSLGPPKKVKQSWNRWPRQVGLFGHKLSYFLRDWLGNSVTLHNTSWRFKLKHTQIWWGKEGQFTAISIVSSFLSPLQFCLNLLFLFIPWSPDPQQIPVIVYGPTWKPACRFENPTPFQVSVVTTFITHKRDREPQLSTEPLVFTLLYLFVYWFCHSSHWSPGRVNLLHHVCEHSSFARKSHQVYYLNHVKAGVFLFFKISSIKILYVFMIVHACVIQKMWLLVEMKEKKSSCVWNT